MRYRRGDGGFTQRPYSHFNDEEWAEIARWANRDGAELYYNPNELDPLDIIRDSFHEYLSSNGNVQNSTMGIEINYIDNESDTAPKTIFLIKRIYEDQEQELLEIQQLNHHHLNTGDFTGGSTIESEQVNQIVNNLRGVFKILQIMLCEVYNDSPEYRERNIQSRNRRSYYPYTIPIKLLYRDILNVNVIPPPPPRRTRATPRYLEEQPEQIAEAQRRRQAGEEPSLEEFPRLDQIDRPTEHTPYALNVVADPGYILEKPINSYVYPGMCILCLEADRSGLCRVNCDAGHIFHCDCINEYRDTYTVYGWNNKCPVCRERINSVANVPGDTDLPMDFGKRKVKKRASKGCDSEIKYLKSLI
jgi:hypothetical protein